MPIQNAQKVTSSEFSSRGNQLGAADDTSKFPIESTPRRTVAARHNNTKSNYYFRSSTRPQQHDESLVNYKKLPAAFPGGVESSSGSKQEPHRENKAIETDQVTEHIPNNADFLFYTMKPLQPRVRLLALVIRHRTSSPKSSCEMHLRKIVQS
jgi:hypothetical protein